MKRIHRFLLTSSFTAFLIVGCFSQQAVAQNKMDTSIRQKDSSPSVTIDDYKRAEKFLGQNIYNKVLGTVSGQTWTQDGKLIYSMRTTDGTQYILADPSSGKKKEAFNRKKLAQRLSELLNNKVNAHHLSLRFLKLSNDGNTLRYRMRRNRYETDLKTYKTKKKVVKNHPKEILSADGKKAAYIKDYNLWVRDTKTGDQTQLTTDGKENYGYATNNAGWIKNDRPVLLWGPNSKQIATFRQDARGVGEMYLYNTKAGHSDLKKWKYSFPGDSTIFRIERVVVHLGNDGNKPKVVRLKIDADAQRSTITDHVADRSGRLLDTEWSADGTQLAFVSVSRNHQKNQLRVADPNTGEVRNVLQENVDTYYESGYSKVSWHVMQKSNEVIWFSERDNWAHLYLYDLKTGQMKHQITEGKWRVLDLQYVDENNRTIYFTGSNREEGNPYYHYLYKINFDGSGLKNLTPQQANHHITWSPSKKYFTDTYSTPTTPPVSVIRNANGKKVMDLEQADIKRLKQIGWKPPTPFVVKARDGKTDLYGFLFKPTNFDSTKSYPVINYLYPGPQSGSIRSWGFSAARGDNQALAELGFIVVEVDAMGTPGRSKSFHDKWYGNMHDNGLPDQVTMIRQLAARHAWMDTTRIGIWGHSGGGYASTDGMLQYPNFYKVAVSESGNHDNRNYESDWGDKWQGLLKGNQQGDNYDRQANENYAKNLKGHLLLIHGLMDDNVPPTNTLLVANALIKAGKDFDMFLIPNAHHGYGYAYYYIMNRRWDYFVKYLMGAQPPAGFRFNENN